MAADPLIKNWTLGPQELNILRERGVQLREGSLKSRGEALLPLMLASFIFDSLVLPSKIIPSYYRNCFLDTKRTAIFYGPQHFLDG